jgi:hypothetical protein
MGKIGKYSSGLSGSAKNAPAPYGLSNGGYEKRQNMMAETEKHYKVGMSKGSMTATGNPSMVVEKNVKRKT